MDQLFLPVFIFNALLILLDASLGYHLVPRLFAALAQEDPDAASRAVQSSRGLLPAIVSLYMFFNCLGYFQARGAMLVTVSILVLIDLLLQAWLRSKAAARDREEQ